MTDAFWTAPRMWPGETVAILGGGSSLTPEQVEAVRGHRVIVINNAYLLAPWADVLYYCDDRWWGWHKDRPQLQAFEGLIVTLNNEANTRAHSLRNMGQEGLQLSPRGLATGCNSGIQAINLAVHFGVARILLLGYDMRPGHWHGGHPVVPPETVYARSMLPKFDDVALALERVGVECINCSPGSAIEVFPRGDIRDFRAA